MQTCWVLGAGLPGRAILLGERKERAWAAEKNRDEAQGKAGRTPCRRPALTARRHAPRAARCRAVAVRACSGRRAAPAIRLDCRCLRGAIQGRPLRGGVHGQARVPHSSLRGPLRARVLHGSAAHRAACPQARAQLRALFRRGSRGHGPWPCRDVRGRAYGRPGSAPRRGARPGGARERGARLRGGARGRRGRAAGGAVHVQERPLHVHGHVVRLRAARRRPLLRRRPRPRLPGVRAPAPAGRGGGARTGHGLRPRAPKGCPASAGSARHRRRGAPCRERPGGAAARLGEEPRAMA